jgi:hypothetical protein
MLQVLHILLAINILLSSAGVTISEHLCLMRGKTIAVFKAAESCCKPTQHSSSTQKDCCKQKQTKTNPTLQRKPCCQDHAHLLKSEINALGKTWGDKYLSALPHFVAVVFPRFAFQRFLEIPNQKILRFLLYKSPSKIIDIQAFIQIFLC